MIWICLKLTSFERKQYLMANLLELNKADAKFTLTTVCLAGFTMELSASAEERYWRMSFYIKAIENIPTSSVTVTFYERNLIKSKSSPPEIVLVIILSNDSRLSSLAMYISSESGKVLVTGRTNQGNYCWMETV